MAIDLTALLDGFARLVGRGEELSASKHIVAASGHPFYYTDLALLSERECAHHRRAGLQTKSKSSLTRSGTQNRLRPGQRSTRSGSIARGCQQAHTLYRSPT